MVCCMLKATPLASFPVLFWNVTLLSSQITCSSPLHVSHLPDCKSPPWLFPPVPHYSGSSSVCASSSCPPWQRSSCYYISSPSSGQMLYLLWFLHYLVLRHSWCSLTVVEEDCGTCSKAFGIYFFWLFYVTSCNFTVYSEFASLEGTNCTPTFLIPVPLMTDCSATDFSLLK